MEGGEGACSVRDSMPWRCSLRFHTTTLSILTSWIVA